MNTRQQQGADIEQTMHRAAELGQDPERVARALGVEPERCREILEGWKTGSTFPRSSLASTSTGRGSSGT